MNDLISRQDASAYSTQGIHHTVHTADQKMEETT